MGSKPYLLVKVVFQNNFLNINILLEIQNKCGRIYFACQNSEIKFEKVSLFIKV
jgi:hypothetical protein